MRNLRREGTLDRVYCIELFLDSEVQDAICARFGIGEGLDPASHYYGIQRQIELHRFLGYDYINVGIEGLAKALGERGITADTVEGVTRRQGGRSWQNESCGIIANWEDFEHNPLLDPSNFSTTQIGWVEKHMPDCFCLCAGCHNVSESVIRLMG